MLAFNPNPGHTTPHSGSYIYVTLHVLRTCNVTVSQLVWSLHQYLINPWVYYELTT